MLQQNTHRDHSDSNKSSYQRPERVRVRANHLAFRPSRDLAIQPELSPPAGRDLIEFQLLGATKSQLALHGVT